MKENDSAEQTAKPAHDTAGWPTRVYRFGAPGWGGKRAITISDHGREQMRLAHRLRNDLVAIAQQSDDTMTAWWADRLPAEVAAVETADAAVMTALKEVGAERVRQRTRDITGPAIDALRAATSARRAAAARLKDAKASVRKGDPDAVKSMQDAARAASRAETKALYQRYSREEGLYWATIGDVIASAQTAEQRVIADRAKGKPAARRFARWDGSGGIAVQLQRESGDPRRTMALLTSGDGKWRNVLRVGPSEYGPRLRRVEFTTGRDRPTVGVDVVWHRDLPEGADVCSVKLVAERVAGHTRYSVHFTARVPPPAPVTEGPDVAVHVGWRADGGATRVGTWRSSAPVTVPARLEGYVTQDTPTSGRVVLGPGIMRRMAFADELRGGRDVALDEMREQLARFLDTEPQPPLRDGDQPLTGSVVRAWKSPNRFAHLALAWRDDPRKGVEGIAEALEAWRVSDRRMWEAEAHGRARAVRHRREVYRLFAAWVASTAGRVLFDDTDLSAVQRKPKTGELLPGKVEDDIAGRRSDVAAGSLREEVVKAATREGVPVEKVSHKDITLMHHACGKKNPPDERWLSAMVTCDGCGALFDQDANAAAGVLARAVQSGTS